MTIVLAAGLAAVALAAVLATVAGARPLRFLHIRHNLSQTPDRVSAHPNLAVSSDGNTVVTVWTERYRSPDFEGGVYLRVASETGGRWGSKITVFPDGSQVAADVRADDVAAVAVAGTTAHVAYIVRGFEDGSLARTEVRYRTCSLTSGQCDEGWESVVIEFDTGYFVGRVDIALDGEQDPHVVWARYNQEKTEREIWYNTPSAGNWMGNNVEVDSTSWAEEDPPIESAPAIACEGGYAHVVWEDLAAGVYSIRYRRRNDASKAWDAAENIMNPDAGRPAGNPDVAAGAGRVFVVWDWCSFDGCPVYRPLYRRADVTDTMVFGDLLEVGTDKQHDLGETNYRSTSDPTKDKYIWDLQPSIALNDAGWPAVAWHASESGGSDDYVIHYSYAITGTDPYTGVVSWITSTVLSQGQMATLGSAAIAVGHSPVGANAPTGASASVGEVASDGEPFTSTRLSTSDGAQDEQHRHIVYMRKLDESAWDVYYDGDEWERYSHVFMPVIMRGAWSVGRG